MLSVLKDENFLYFVYLDDAVYLLFVVIAIGVVIWTERNIIEEYVDPKVLLCLQWGLALKERLEERPED